MADSGANVPSTAWSEALALTMLPNFRPVVLKCTNDRELSVLKTYADFWKIPFQISNNGGAESTIFTSDRATATDRSRSTVVLSPVGKKEFEKTASEYGAKVSSEKRLIQLPVRRGIMVSLTTDVYEFSGSGIEHILKTDGSPILSRVRGTGVHLLSVDLVTEYERLVNEGLEEIPSWKFRIVSRLPLSYGAVPLFIRNRAFRSKDGMAEIREENLGPVESLRSIFLATLVKCSGPIPRLGFWRRGKSYALAVTHDVETAAGLTDGTDRLMEVEESLGIRSTWNVPSDRYPLYAVSLTRLREVGEIGAHDTKHDGRLLFSGSEEKIRRVAKCKDKLERLTGQKIRGFRAPLLQHNKGLLQALSHAGYQYDSSCPSWEILSPTSLRPHGVGTIFPFYADGILEVPVSLPQDHQLIRVAGQKTSDAVDLLIRLSSWIRGLGGACILLTHPDYEFGNAENRDEYHRLLDRFRSDPECDIMTLGEIVDWWNLRNRARIQLGGDHVSIVSQDSENLTRDLQVELVTDYGEDGFKVADVSPVGLASSSSSSQASNFVG